MINLMLVCVLISIMILVRKVLELSEHKKCLVLNVGLCSYCCSSTHLEFTLDRKGEKCILSLILESGYKKIHNLRSGGKLGYVIYSYKHLDRGRSSIKNAHFVPIHSQTWPPQAILVSGWPIFKNFLV
jgi:hypothetical protein